MRLLRYDVAPHHRLIFGLGRKVVNGGETFEVSDEMAERLLADRHVPVTAAYGPPRAADEHTTTNEGGMTDG